ncbi:MAG: hypothetical protein OXB93_01880 [Cytophagales bacterium]|nr:hypothetical protein [Cytophagales bacterium]
MLFSDSNTQKWGGIKFLHDLADAAKNDEQEDRVQDIFRAFDTFVNEVSMPKSAMDKNLVSRAKGSVLQKITKDPIYSKYRNKPSSDK